MREYRHNLARARRRPVRLVTPAAAASSIAIPEPERTALIVGLTFAAHLQRLFPAFYEEHIARTRAPIRTVPYSLLGTMAAFLSLAHTELLALDISAHRETTAGTYGGYGLARIIYAPKDPSKAFYQNVGETTARYLLAQDGKAWLHQPVPKVYGLGPDEVTSRGNYRWNYRWIDKHSLALAIWRLVGATAWAPLPAERVSEIAAQSCVDEAGGQAIAVLPTIPAGTPLPLVCAELDRQNLPGLKHLGTLIAYCCGRTDNGFADVTPAEARQQYDQVIDLDWERPAEAFVSPRAQQQQAASYARAYSHLAGKLTRDPDLLLRIRSAVLDAAAHVGNVTGYVDTFGTYNPAALYWRVTHETD